MLQLQNQCKRKKYRLFDHLNLIGRCAVSWIIVLLIQIALSLIPHFFFASSLIIQLTLSVLALFLVVGLGRLCRWIFGVSASAPALVFFNVLFVWGVYICFVRQAISHFSNVVFNGEVSMLLIGLFSILSSDPGFVTYGSLDSNKLDETRSYVLQAHNERVRYCKTCMAYVKGFDHHCPAFGNCIGEKNYVLFMLLLVGFLITEVSYIMVASRFTRGSWILGEIIFENDLARNLVVGTMIFSVLQVLWQLVFLAWHIYCICSNIKTDEWINWKKYPEFQLEVQSLPRENLTEMRFTNPYDKGILENLKGFLAVKC